MSGGRSDELRSELAAELAAEEPAEGERADATPPRLTGPDPAPAEPSPLPSAPDPQPLPDVPTAIGTPALSVRLTPLRWTRPRLDSSEQGAGLAVRVGPFRIEVTV